MATAADYLKSGEEPYMQFSNMKLRLYFPHEIDRLSVVNVGHPIKNGLYDPALGPHNVNDKCETCGLYDRHCPGHMGHIQIDVPVFNPMLFAFTYNLMKGSCVHCHRLTCKSDGIAAKILLGQLRCFELGVPHIAMELESVLRDKVVSTSEFDAGGELNEDQASLTENVDEMIRRVCGVKSLEELAKKPPIPTKNVAQLKNTIVNQYLKTNLFNRKKKCPLCKQRNGEIRNDGNRSMLLDFGGNLTLSKKKVFITDGPIKEVDTASDDEKDVKDDGINAESLVLDSTEGSLNAQMRRVRDGECTKLAWRAAEVREHFRMLFKNDGELLLKIFPMFNDETTKEGDICPLDGLFCERILVPPNKFRPLRMFKGSQYEDPQTVNLRKVLESGETIKAIALIINGDKSSQLRELVTNRVQGKTINEQMHNAYIYLQQRVNAIFDEDLNKGDKDHIAGIKQILEKKQGLFRMNMMGKRVNFACRSVITPDPYLDIDEIGIPDIFAKKLTFPEPVNMMNLKKMKKQVKNGPEVHPGANFVIEPNQRKTFLGIDAAKRQAQAKTIQPASVDSLRTTTKVLRHLQNGDMIMMNRQPSLHKPSIMGHRARVLTGQRALRMNYAPCKAYNADFDGDEMNGHLVQTYVAQTEVREIANVGSNFLVPKDATPLLGLIQDHVVSGVLLTLRDRFLTKDDFMHLVFASFAAYSKRIEIPPPAMLKPKMLWTGKQVISCIVKNLTPEGAPLINLDGKAKTPLSCWTVGDHKPPKFDMSESQVIFRGGELLVGVLDKAHFGATQFGLAHCMFELYGSQVGVKLLSCFSRLFTTYLQFHGFTLGVADILVREGPEEKRREAVKQSRVIGDQVVRTTFGLDETATRKEIRHTLAATYCNPRGQGQDVKMLDFGMKQAISKYNDAITKSCVPTGLLISFPENALQLMIQSGAKGSAVNAIQISGCLGQIELEGKRMAVTIAGRTLPSFRAFDPSPRAGGYIDQRFLTGINPQELYFHTMAGREGLIDTAVKTSRSGYLQRCIIKHLEGIRVHYDNTVRDHDGSVIQFRYGEDGLDVTKSTFIGPKTLPFIEENLEAFTLASKPKGIKDSEMNIKDSEKWYKKIAKWRKKNKNASSKSKSYVSAFTIFAMENEGMSTKKILGSWFELSEEQKKAYLKRVPKKCPDSVDEVFNPNRTLGALPEKTLDVINKYCDDVKEGEDSKDQLRRTLFWKGMRSMAEPGENVGLLAAQSIGEPSTQMTLNTFHFAGRGEMNVTLGIPRLREILMTASKNIATPSAQIAVIPGTPRSRIDEIKQELDRVFLKQLLKNFTLEEKVTLSFGKASRRYTLKIEILASHKREQGARHVEREDVIIELEKRFFQRVASSIGKKYSEVEKYQQLSRRTMNMADKDGTDSGPVRHGVRGPDDGESSDEEADKGRDADAAEKRLNARHNDEAAEYEGEDEERRNVGEKEQDSDDSEIEESNNMDDEIDIEKKRAQKEFEEKNAMLNQGRIQKVLKLDMVSNYIYDEKKGRWCSITFELPLKNKTKLDVASIVEKEIEGFIVSQTPGIERCVESEGEKDGKPVILLQTQGVNLQAFYKHADVLDVNTVYSNDLNLVLNNYGVEACAKAIVTEMNNVFAVYGIEVSKRHLSLTADHMVFTGEIMPFNRGAIASNTSPLQKMTFETTMAFLREALLKGEVDQLNSPSARLVIGGLSHGGTGAFDVLVDQSVEPDVEIFE